MTSLLYSHMCLLSYWKLNSVTLAFFHRMLGIIQMEAERRSREVEVQEAMKNVLRSCMYACKFVCMYVCINAFQGYLAL